MVGNMSQRLQGGFNEIEISGCTNQEQIAKMNIHFVCHRHYSSLNDDLVPLLEIVIPDSNTHNHPQY